MSPNREEYDQFSHEHSLENLTNWFVVACIPAFNEEKNIGGVIIRALKYVDRVVICDDGSSDLTGEIAMGLGAIVVRHERNMGYGVALKSSFQEAIKLGADIIVTLDGDGQHDPKEIPRLLKRLGTGDVEIVIGSRFLVGGGTNAPKWREAGIKMITGLTSNKELEVTDAQSGFRAFNRKALESLVLTEEGMGISTEILLKAGENGLKVAEVPVNISYSEGSSTHNPVFHGVDVVLNTIKHISMRRPLLFYGLPGLVSMGIAAVFWAITLRIYASTKAISTNITLIALSATFVGLILMTTAIIIWVLISVIREKNMT
ncbi:MAG: glycosyltransferase family 2 protein [Candidatus Hodarchaeota archaeon]